MTHSASRTPFVGTAYLQESGGRERPFVYEGSYSQPLRDRQGCLRFGWTATVRGLEDQPQPAPRTTVMHEVGRELPPDFVERRIQRSIEEHLSAYLADATAKMR
ncbi:hypothetical protein GN316_03270 [Xylophilus sp. Kf1]|nr:hypothetical protein [Xylophilus sp. Kf1]